MLSFFSCQEALLSPFFEESPFPSPSHHISTYLQHLLTNEDNGMLKNLESEINNTNDDENHNDNFK